jgi:hypothetical protein
MRQLAIGSCSSPRPRELKAEDDPLEEHANASKEEFIDVGKQELFAEEVVRVAMDKDSSTSPSP